MSAAVWQRLDHPGREAARLVRDGDGWRLEGTAVLSYDRTPCKIDYAVRCDAAWRTRATHVGGWIGEREIAIDIASDGAGHWTLNDRPVPDVDGCLDVDLGFSPSTNTLPIRRLALEVGAGADVSAAWLSFPGLELQRLDQRYERTAPECYRYISRGGSFIADLRVDAAGLVVLYPGFWSAD